MRFVFVMDPFAAMLPTKDTSFAFMRAAAAKGFTCFHCEPHQLFARGRDLWARVRRLDVSEEPPHFHAGAPEDVALEAVDAVFVRKDPPFDARYLHMTQQLELVRRATLIVNDPRGLRDANEKLFALHFSHLMPKTLVTSSTDDALAFVAEVGGEGVLKPLDGAGGAGVVGVRAGDRNARGIVDLLTHEGRELVMVQEFRKEVVGGDKRVLLLDGNLLGAIRRVPREDDIRANIHVGGRVEPTTLTAGEQALVDEIGPKLSAMGLYFVGLDVIGEKLIEVNVTSPTGIQELGRLTSTTPEADVIAWVERRASAHGR